METPHNLGGNYWGTLINPDKSPAPLLEQLCLGIAELLATLQPSGGTMDLLPGKLATFYREVGGNYDTLFLDTKGPALSFIYQSLGCFHTLQPTANPYEPPSIPALLPVGFVRWQTIQLLLSPDEHVQYLQSAVSRWDVPNPNGGTFPKAIPRESFPASPDKDMVEWHENVSRCLERDYETRHSRRHFPRDFVRYYSAASRTGDKGSQKEDYFSHGASHHRSGVDSRRRAGSDDDLRAYGRTSAEGRGSWRSRFETAFDKFARERRSGDSRTSSPQPSPLFPRPLSRSKTTQANREGPAAPSTRRRPAKFSFGSLSAGSSEDEDIPPPSRRRGSIDDRRHVRRERLSPGRIPMPRRHSHDDTTTNRPNGGRDRGAFPSSSGQRETGPSRPQRYRSSKIKSDDLFTSKSSRKRAGAKVKEHILGDGRPSSWSYDYPYPLGDKSNTPRFQINTEGPSPTDAHRSGHRNSGGSSGSDRPRSSTNAGIGSARPPKWDSPFHVAAKRTSLHE